MKKRREGEREVKRRGGKDWERERVREREIERDRRRRTSHGESSKVHKKAMSRPNYRLDCTRSYVETLFEAMTIKNTLLYKRLRREGERRRGW